MLMHCQFPRRGNFKQLINLRVLRVSSEAGGENKHHDNPVNPVKKFVFVCNE
jgi:hypothetical protein